MKLKDMQALEYRAIAPLPAPEFDGKKFRVLMRSRMKIGGMWKWVISIQELVDRRAGRYGHIFTIEQTEFFTNFQKTGEYIAKDWQTFEV